jgi:hypothetical protein
MRAPRLDRRSSGLLLATAIGAALVLLPARRSVAQNAAFERLNLDKLQITALGASYGHIIPSQAVPTNIIQLQADYGNLSPTWRLVFAASYWESQYEDDVVQAFADSLRKSLANPSDRVIPSQVRLYDVTFSGDARYTPDYSGELKPFIGFGLSAHVINAEGQLVKGTFVERALDDIAVGLYATAGVSLRLFSHFGVEGSARADLLSGFRSTQVRAGGMYYFGHVRGPRTALETPPTNASPLRNRAP